MEIYIYNKSINELLYWLLVYFSDLSQPEQIGDSIMYEAKYNAMPIKIILTEHIEQLDFTSVWIKADGFPWRSLREFGLAAAETLGTKVRYEKCELSDAFYEINGSVEKQIVW